MGSPIRTPPDQRFVPTPRRFSQAHTSFFASYCLGIHRMHFSSWIYIPKLIRSKIVPPILRLHPIHETFASHTKLQPKPQCASLRSIASSVTQPLDHLITLKTPNRFRIYTHNKTSPKTSYCPLTYYFVKDHIY